MKVVILAGGKGTRLFPISRENYPKQFVQYDFLGGLSTYQKTLKRAKALVPEEDIIVVTNEEYKYYAINQAEEAGVKISEEQLILEKEGRGTLPAIFLASLMVREEEDVLVLPSDHLVENIPAFVEDVNYILEFLDEGIVLFGIPPTYPNTEYGYILPEERRVPGVFVVDKFIEKPPREVAEEIIFAGGLWNSGMFAFNNKLFHELLKKTDSYIYNLLTERGLGGLEELKYEWSFDKHFLESVNRNEYAPIFVKVASFDWLDLGNYDTLMKVLPKDNNENAVLGDVFIHESNNNLVFTRKKAVLNHVKDLIVIDERDVLLVTTREGLKDMKYVYKELEAKNPSIVRGEIVGYRPWGKYEVLYDSKFFKVKLITVYPGKRLSLQRHYHRSEHWVVVEGTAKVMVGEKEFLLRPGESIYIPLGEIHRLENPGKVPLKIIEVQLGEYLGEDDIERLDDDYGRKKKH